MSAGVRRYLLAIKQHRQHQRRLRRINSANGKSNDNIKRSCTPAACYACCLRLKAWRLSWRNVRAEGGYICESDNSAAAAWQRRRRHRAWWRQRGENIRMAAMAIDGMKRNNQRHQWRNGEAIGSRIENGEMAAKWQSAIYGENISETAMKAAIIANGVRQKWRKRWRRRAKAKAAAWRKSAALISGVKCGSEMAEQRGGA
jgi:hypothetical protein